MSDASEPDRQTLPAKNVINQVAHQLREAGAIGIYDRAVILRRLATWASESADVLATENRDAQMLEHLTATAEALADSMEALRGAVVSLTAAKALATESFMSPAQIWDGLHGPNMERFLGDMENWHRKVSASIEKYERIMPSPLHWLAASATATESGEGTTS